MFSLISLHSVWKGKVLHIIIGSFISLLGVSLFEIVSGSSYASSEILEVLVASFAYGYLYQSSNGVSLGIYTYLAVYVIYLIWFVSAIRFAISVPLQNLVNTQIINKIKSNIFILIALLGILITPMLDPLGLKIYGGAPSYFSFKITQLLFLTLSIAALMDLIIVFRAQIRK